MTFPVRVYVTDISYPEAFYDRWYDAMPGARRERTDRFRMEADRRRCIMAYALLTHAVSLLATELDMTDTWELEGGLPETGRDQNGKPYFTDIPVHFNISHAGDRVMAALSPQTVGCDVEVKNRDALKIAGRCFTKREYELLCSITDENIRAREFTKLWTMKESVVKCCGEGIRRKFDDFSLVDENGDRIYSQKLDGLGKTYHIREYGSENGYCYSCCSTYDIFENDLIRCRI